MINRKYPSSGLLLITLLVLSLQFSSAAENLLLREKLPVGWDTAEVYRVFRAADLYGHINGGSELFLEFGFDSLQVQNYAKGSDQLTVELYTMRSALSALGLYLLKCGEEKSTAVLKARHTVNAWQLMMVKGNIYIQINNPEGKESLKRSMIKFAAVLENRIQEDNHHTLLDSLPRANKITNSDFIIRGPYGLQKIYYFSDDDIFNLGGKWFAAGAEYREQDTITTKIIIFYRDMSMARDVFNNLPGRLDPTIHMLEGDSQTLLFKDFKNELNRISLTGRKLLIHLHIPSP